MLLDVTRIEKRFGSGAQAVQVLAGVSLQLTAGESVALTGESGSGKSTLLHICAGLEQADAGQVQLAGTALRGLGERARAGLRRKSIGIVFQQFNLIPSLNVGRNLVFQARLAGRRDLAFEAHLAERLGLSDLLQRYPDQLSGGQQQRVAIGRALAGRPALLLADEPTGNLDEATGTAVMDLLLELVAASGAGLLMVTHSTALAARLDRRLHLRAGRLL